MADFLYSSSRADKRNVEQELQKIDVEKSKTLLSLAGDWGALAFFENHYPYTSHIEEKDFVLVLLGGPVIKNTQMHSVGENKCRVILHEWFSKKNTQFDQYVHGPFCIICIDKKSKQVHIVTDLMNFIPVYSSVQKNSEAVIAGTHVDNVARLSKREKDIDEVSIADSILNKAVTFPYTSYKLVNQMNPATEYIIKAEEKAMEAEDYYWLPVEEPETDFEKAALNLRKNFRTVVEDLKLEKQDTAILMSGGEDSRILLNAIPSEAKKNGFIFLDSPNKELSIAKRIAKLYGVDLRAGFRSPTYYLDSLYNVSKMLGSDHKFFHAHAYGYHRIFRLEEYTAVLGGLGADAYYKGRRIKNVNKHKIKGIKYKLDTLDKGQQSTDKYLSSYNKQYDFVKKEIYSAISDRRRAHKEFIKTFRPGSASEWIELWPAAMNHNMANFFSHRRLFRNYEPYLHNEVLKIAANVPQEFKMNRRLFHEAFHPDFRKSKFISHANGSFPYFNAKINFPIMAGALLGGKIINYVRSSKVKQESWPDWEETTQAYRGWIAKELDENKAENIMNLISSRNLSLEEILNGLDGREQVSLLQLAHNLHREDQK
jgi:hypothetical protein